MGRRRFDHLVVELSVAAGGVVPRYALWLCLSERGWEPERLERSHVAAFLDTALDDFLAAHTLRVVPRARRRPRRAVLRFDPRSPTPYETMERLAAPDP